MQMCMATYIPAGVPIPYEGLENGAIQNNDGHGFAVAGKDGIVVGKSMVYEEALELFVNARNNAGHGALSMFHSRWATAGTVDEFNCHPFYAGDQTVVAHNGVFGSKWQPRATDPRSDTRIFTETTLPMYLTERGIPSRRGGKALGNLIGSGNKLVIMSVADGHPKVRIVNAHAGVHAEGVWFSNSGYLPSRWTYRSNWDGRWPWEKDDKKVDTCKTNKPYYSETMVCDVCWGKGYIDIETNVCDACGYCLDCYCIEEECQCWKGRLGISTETDDDLLARWAKAEEEREAVAQLTLDKWSTAMSPWSVD